MSVNVSKLPFYIRYTIVAVCIVFTIIIMREASSLLIPLFAGLLLAILLLPLVTLLERIHIPSSAACLLAVLCFIILFMGVNYFLTAEISAFSSEMPNINIRVQGMITSFQQWLTAKFHIDRAQQTGYMSSSFKDIVNGITGFVTQLFLSLGNIVIWILFVCVYTYFILFYRKLLVRFIMKLVENDYPDEMVIIVGENKKIIKGYIRGLLIEFVIVLLLSVVSLMIMGIKYAVMLGIIVALLNIIPYLGIYTAIVIVLILTYVNSSGAAAIQAGIVLLAIHLFDSIFLLPKVVGSRMKMNAFITIVAVIAGDIVWGIPGMFLFIPLAAMLRIMFENIASLEAWAILFGEEPKNLKIKGKKK